MVIAELREMIVRGTLAPGERISASDIGRRLGVSYTPAREALQLLEGEGLVRSDPFRGARVAELDADESEEAYLLREALERLASRLGTAAISNAGLAMMEKHLAAMEAAAGAALVDAYIEADWAFHAAHFRASGRERLWLRILALRRESERYTRLSFERDPGRMIRNARLHRELLEHVKARDVVAAEAWVSAVLGEARAAVAGLIADVKSQSGTLPVLRE